MTRTDAPLVMATVYAHPRDYPDHFVVRCFDITREGPKPHQVASLHKTVDEAREYASKGGERVCFAREPADDEAIVETWL